jgi:hypothetical protein
MKRRMDVEAAMAFSRELSRELLGTLKQKVPVDDREPDEVTAA